MRSILSMLAGVSSPGTSVMIWTLQDCAHGTPHHDGQVTVNHPHSSAGAVPTSPVASSDPGPEERRMVDQGDHGKRENSR